MIDKYNVTECCGCGLCSNICPTDAIQMISDIKGFFYPKINMDKCINCNLCETKCIFNNDDKLHNNVQEYYLTRIKVEDILKKSTSGGLFTAISDYFINDDGVVIGAMFDEHFVVRHTLALNASNRDKMRGSKYVQSDISDVYHIIQTYLPTNKVLFVGTPCQVSAIQSYVNLKFRNLKENLITIDIICHGVPSPSLWHDHLSLLPKRNELINVSCRSKLEGWRSNLDVYTYSNHSTITSHDSNKNGINAGKMTELFYKKLSFRESCSNCRFTSMDRVGDFSIGDAWGVENVQSELDDNKGWSLLFVNTSVAKKILPSISNNLILYPIDDISHYNQPQLNYPIVLGKRYNEFWSDYSKYGGEYCFKKYTTYGYKNRVIYYAKSFVKKIIK